MRAIGDCWTAIKQRKGALGTDKRALLPGDMAADVLDGAIDLANISQDQQQVAYRHAARQDVSGAQVQDHCRAARHRQAGHNGDQSLSPNDSHLAPDGPERSADEAAALPVFLAEGGHDVLGAISFLDNREAGALRLPDLVPATPQP